jgi:broad specificity phosphatase PhoE
MILKKAFILFLTTALLTACSGEEEANAPSAEPSLTTLILVRHAEKADEGTDDPPLTAQGKARADRISSLLSASGIDAIYSTPFQRNIHTVKPLADTLGLNVITYDPKRDLVEWVEELLQKHPGQKVLVCGHSSTVPGMLNVLVGENRYENLADGEYDDLFIVSVTEKGRVAVLPLKYALDER